MNVRFKTEKIGEDSFLHLIIESSEIEQCIDYINPLENKYADIYDKLDILYDFLDKKIVDIVEINEKVKDAICELDEKRVDEIRSMYDD